MRNVLFIVLPLSSLAASQSFNPKNYANSVDETIPVSESSNLHIFRFVLRKNENPEQAAQACARYFGNQSQNTLIQCYAYRSSRLISAYEVSHKNAEICWAAMAQWNYKDGVQIKRNYALLTPACTPQDR